MDKEAMQCQHLIFGLDITARTSATCKNEASWRMSTNQDSSVSAISVCKLLHSNAGWTNTDTTEPQDKKSYIKNSILYK
jgi:hypothetical protein